MELGNGAGSGPGAQPQLSPTAEQQARIDERQKYVDALDAGLELSKGAAGLAKGAGPHAGLARRAASETITRRTGNQVQKQGSQKTALRKLWLILRDLGPAAV